MSPADSRRLRHRLNLPPTGPLRLKHVLSTGQGVWGLGLRGFRVGLYSIYLGSKGVAK